MTTGGQLTGHALRLDNVQAKVAPHGLTKVQVRAVVDAFGEELVAGAAHGRTTWPGIGSFRIARRRGRRISNPQTGESMELQRSWALAFRASKLRKGFGDGPL